MAGYYATYIMGKDAYIQGTLSNFGIVEKKKMKKLTVKQQLKNAEAQVKEHSNEIGKLRAQMHEQNNLLDRVRVEANQLIEKYNKLAGKYNAIRSLVTNND